MINLRTASLQDLELLNYWDTKRHVIESNGEEEWDWEKELIRTPSWRELLIAELQGEAIGFMQIIDPYLEETHYWGKVEPNKKAIDIWIGEEKNLNLGYGTIMMQLAIKKCFEDESTNGILVDPLKTNTKAQRFYERLGFEFVEERDFEETACLVYELKRKR